MAVRGMKWPGAANLVISLLAVHKGEWDGPRMLDDQLVRLINTFFEEGEEKSEPNAVFENSDRVFQGSIFLGDGFLLTHAEADRLRDSDPRNADVIMPIINGKELNNDPYQAPGRSIINFRNWPLEKAQAYHEPYDRVMTLVKPVRDADKMRSRRENWWKFGALASGLYNNIRDLPRCFVTGRVTKHMNFSALPTDIVFLNNCYVFATDRWDLFAVVQSSLHEVWARKYSMSLKQDLQYSPSNCFRTFAFPSGLWQAADSGLAEIGEHYHAHRQELMRSLGLGLTKTYNLFHARDLSSGMVAKASKKDTHTATTGCDALIKLRHLHVALDIAVRDAYGWQDLDLDHGFHEVETLPENDRVRYTISPTARREALKRLLEENHTRAKAEAKRLTKKPKRASHRATPAAGGPDLFSRTPGHPQSR